LQTPGALASICAAIGLQIVDLRSNWLSMIFGT